MFDKLERGISANSSVLKSISHDGQLMKPLSSCWALKVMAAGGVVAGAMLFGGLGQNQTIPKNGCEPIPAARRSMPKSWDSLPW